MSSNFTAETLFTEAKEKFGAADSDINGVFGQIESIIDVCLVAGDRQFRKSCTNIQNGPVIGPRSPIHQMLQCGRKLL